MGPRPSQKEGREGTGAHSTSTTYRWIPGDRGLSNGEPAGLGLSTRPRIVGSRTCLGGDESSDDGLRAFAERQVVKVHTGGDTVSTKKPSRAPLGSEICGTAVTRNKCSDSVHMRSGRLSHLDGSTEPPPPPPGPSLQKIAHLCCGTFRSSPR